MIQSKRPYRNQRERQRTRLLLILVILALAILVAFLAVKFTEAAPPPEPANGKRGCSITLPLFAPYGTVITNLKICQRLKLPIQTFG